MHVRFHFPLAIVALLGFATAAAQDAADYQTQEMRLADAIDSGSVAAVRRLLDAGVSPNTMVHEAPALQWALWDKRYYAAKLLIERGADVNVADADGYTSLMVAAAVDDERSARLLLDNHADVNATEQSYGMSPLQVACESGAHQIVHLLLQRGANVQHNDHYGGNCLEEAAFYGYGDIVRTMRQQGLDTKWPLHVACGLGQLERVQQLLADGQPADQPNDGWHNTPLHFAAGGGHPKVAQLLLDHGAKLDACNVLGATPLHASAGADTVDFARWAIAQDADVNAPDEQGSTPLDWAGGQTYDYLRTHGGEHSEDETDGDDQSDE